jgi:hypothetical protein
MGVIEGTWGILGHAGVPNIGADEVQTVTLGAVPAAGQFRIAFMGFRTGLLAFNAAAAVVEAALEALPTIGVGNIVVGLIAQQYTLTFQGDLAKLALPLVSIEDNTVVDGGAVPVVITPAESVAGVTADGRGIRLGGFLLDITAGTLYQNKGTQLEPVWDRILAGINIPAASVNNLVEGWAGGYKLARGQHTTVAASDDIGTGLATVVSVVASLDDDPVDGAMHVTASIGDQAGTPIAGNILIKTWKSTDADATLIAATTFAKKVNWIAVGT